MPDKTQLLYIYRMSNERRQRRQTQHAYKKNAKEINWPKMKATLKTLAWAYPLAAVCFFILFFLLTFFSVQSRNKKRREVLASLATATAAITKIYDGKNSHYASFSFRAKGTIYKGETFHGYKGHVGDSVCVMYDTNEPTKNIYCVDAQLETFQKEVFEHSLWITAIAAGFMFVIIPLVFIYLIVTGDRQTINNYTRKKNR